MNSSNTNSGGWTSCAMRSTHLPAILALMPTEVQNGIREVNKMTSAGSQSATINTTADKLFLLSEIEIFGSVSYSKSGEGTQYDYYKAGNSKVKNYNGSAYYWWERSPYGSNSACFCYVNSSGYADCYYASSAYWRGLRLLLLIQHLRKSRSLCAAGWKGENHVGLQIKTGREQRAVHRNGKTAGGTHLRVLHEGTEAVRAVSDRTHHGAEQRGA